LTPKAHAWLGDTFDLVVTKEMSGREFMDGLQETYAEEFAQGLVVNAPEPINLGES